jgi:hypothetical protein
MSFARGTRRRRRLNIVPRLLNYVVAIYLIIVGIVGLNSIHHFIR